MNITNSNVTFDIRAPDVPGDAIFLGVGEISIQVAIVFLDAINIVIIVILPCLGMMDDIITSIVVLVVVHAILAVFAVFCYPFAILPGLSRH